MLKFKVCLTGGIASGKTHVSDQLATLGAHVIDADVLAREVVQADSSGLQQVVAVFGEEILYSDRSLNRKALKEIVFNDEVKLLKLNSILHPLIRKAFAAASESNLKPLEIWVIPLFDGTGVYDYFDRILVVDVALKTQLQRITHRDQLSNDIAQSIIDSQPSRDLRLAIANDVIVNNHGFDELDKAVLAMYKLYMKLKNIKME